MPVMVEAPFPVTEPVLTIPPVNVFGVVDPGATVVGVVVNANSMPLAAPVMLPALLIPPVKIVDEARMPS